MTGKKCSTAEARVILAGQIAEEENCAEGAKRADKKFSVESRGGEDIKEGRGKARRATWLTTVSARSFWGQCR